IPDPPPVISATLPSKRSPIRPSSVPRRRPSLAPGRAPSERRPQNLTGQTAIWQCDLTQRRRRPGTRSMDMDDTTRSLAGWCGLAWAALTTAAALTGGSAPALDAPATEITDYL